MLPTTIQRRLKSTDQSTPTLPNSHPLPALYAGLIQDSISGRPADLAVTVHGIAVKPGLALGSWAGFRKSGAQAVVHGDLVLTQAEINPVISTLQQHGFEITALHNHLINETPSVMYLHFWGEGDAAMLAQSLKDALSKTRTPMAARAFMCLWGAERPRLPGRGPFRIAIIRSVPKTTL